MTPEQQVRWDHYVDLLRVDLENMEGEEALGETSWLKVVQAVAAELDRLGKIETAARRLGLANRRVDELEHQKEDPSSDDWMDAQEEELEALHDLVCTC